MNSTAKSIIAGISFYIEGNSIEIPRRILRHYSHDDLSAEAEAIDYLVKQSEAYFVKNPREAEEDDICIVMLKYPNGIIPYKGWKTLFNKMLSESTYLSKDIIKANLIQT